MDLFNNKKVTDLQEKVNYLQNKINDLEAKFIKLEFQIKNPKPYKIGDKYSKNEIVTNIELVQEETPIIFNFNSYRMYYNVEVTNTKTGNKFNRYLTQKNQ